MASERKIGKRVFRCAQLPAVDALELFGEFTQKFDPYTMQAVRDGADRKTACESFLVLSAQSDKPVELHEFFKRAAELCQVDGDTCVVGVHTQTLEDLAEVAFFALEVQFRGFLSVALASPTGEAARPAG